MVCGESEGPSLTPLFSAESLHVNISSTPAPAETEKNSHHKQVEKISTPSLKPVSDQTPIFKINNPYANLLDPLVDKMLDYCNLDTHPSGSSPDDMFQTIVTQSSSRGNFSVEIAKLKGHDFFFRVVCDMETTPETAFDILSDIDRRKEWDEVVSKSGVVAKIGKYVSRLKKSFVLIANI